MAYSTPAGRLQAHMNCNLIVISQTHPEWFFRNQLSLHHENKNIKLEHRNEGTFGHKSVPISRTSMNPGEV
ncbi:16787_t:CDS:2 [Entrophospora sp. SA101]|nr:19439_t:CDS:2 [Entrophospora sp. SA101]CAJ0925501.1 16787_t:CDS:2 [Entrophospora sp. SA101]